MRAGPTRKRAAPALAIGLALALLLVACAGDRSGSPQRTGSSPQGTPSRTSHSPSRVWIAVFQSAEDPNDLEAASEELMEKAGTAVVVAPEGCFGGLRGRGDIRPGDYVLAVMADSRDGLDVAVGRADREPVVTARVEDDCPV